MDIKERFFQYVDQTDTCWLWIGSTIKGRGYAYGRFSYTGGKHIYAHRYSWEHHNGPIPEGMLVLHKCDVPQCVNPEHLFLGTHQDNMTDKVNKHRLVSSPGESNGMAKLTTEDVHKIRALYAADQHLQREIGDMFGVSNRQISRIVRGERWKKLQ